MAYTDVITLAQARIYLRIDDTQNDSDAEITQMINTALSYLEKRTNVIVDPRDILYYFEDCLVRIYDFPINSITDPVAPSVDDITQTDKQLYSIFTTSDPDIETITLNVGYADPLNVPDEIVQAGLYLIKLMYYETESEKTLDDMLPIWTKELINANRRFIV